MKIAFQTILLLAIIGIHNSVWCAENTLSSDASLNLIGKKYRIANINGVRSIRALPDGQQNWEALQRDGKRCQDNVAWVDPEDGEKAIIKVEGTPLLMVFLSCPAGESDIAWIVSLIDLSDVDKPKCSGYINLMEKSNYFFSGALSSWEMRAGKNNDYFIGVRLEGGDAGDNWQSISFLHMNSRCDIKNISQFYASTHYSEEPDEAKCGGSKIDYHFIDSEQVVFDSRELSCADGVETFSENPPVKHNLRTMLSNEKNRTFQP